MKVNKVKSYAKINLTLNILGKPINSKLHKIESLISFIDLADNISISENKTNSHQVKFNGKFSKGIPKSNSVSKVLSLLDQKNLLKGKKYKILITKNIPQKSGMGGGSMNAASILNFFLRKRILNLKNAENYAKKIGSDVILGLKNNKTKILFSNNKLKELNKKINFHIVLIKPNFGCSTEKVYSRNKIFSKKQYFEKKNIKIDKFHIFDGKNDLENSAFKTYPELKKLKNRALAIQKGELVRMTGSGATIVVYFSSKVSAKNALKTYKRKLNKNWCILSKII
jgi:4-diphosphocytidyl-2-C-methyl-D-erythritol kinase|tara:strand:- start:74 stop:922 length:849 start_codon:yes stop_codon:yes gene_type:complete